ncbi:hypothetical protein [Streptomyces sp. NBC_00443]|uniref:hypothetical protein n=1 Tax=Streptomyces sp. NBC_00443 TaxID=2975743 RepID=UPI002E24CBB0
MEVDNGVESSPHALVAVGGRDDGRRVGLGGTQAGGDDRVDRGPHRMRPGPGGDDVPQLLALQPVSSITVTTRP